MSLRSGCGEAGYGSRGRVDWRIVAFSLPLSALRSPYRRDKGEGRKRHASEWDDEPLPLPLPTCILFLRGCRHCRHCRHLPKTLRSEPCAGVEWTQWSEKSRGGATHHHTSRIPLAIVTQRLAGSQTTPPFFSTPKHDATIQQTATTTTTTP
jgi:hypothetical protein